MKHALLRRSWLAGVAVAVTAVLAPGVAQAEPPSNDDFDNATAITALPFEGTADLTEATKAPDDPTSCIWYGSKFVWFRYTAPVDGIVKVTQTTSDVYEPVIAAYTGTRGALRQVPGFCSFGGSETFHATAGETYHLLVGSTYSGGTISLRVESVPPSTNDDFADAERIPGLPTTVTGDLARAGAEPGEPPTSCGQEATQSIWYTYTPTSSRWVSVIPIGQTGGTVVAYRGSSLTTLSELDCQVNRYVVFRAELGEAYHIRVSAPPAEADRLNVGFRTAPALHPYVSTNQEPGSVFNDIYLYTGAGDELNRPIVSGELKFGDGTSTPITSADYFLKHRYAADGVYQLELTVTTDDGRTGTTTEPLRIETHDVTVSGFAVPSRARVDQTKPITVSVTNNRYDETVEVELYKQTGSYFTRIGVQTQFMPAGRTTQFPFAYTFSAADATAGSVTFKTVVRPRYPSDDDNTVDNEKIATTTVTP